MEEYPKGGSILKNSIRWKVKSGASISLWDDPWVDPLLLREIRNNQVTDKDANLVVGDIHDENREWNLSRITTHLPFKIIQKVKGIPITMHTRDGEDTLCWNLSPNGSMPTKSA